GEGGELGRGVGEVEGGRGGGGRRAGRARPARLQSAQGRRSRRLARRRARSPDERLGAGGRCAPRGPLPGASAGAAPRVALRSHAGGAECPIDVGDRERKTGSTGKTSAGAPNRRRPP